MTPLTPVVHVVDDDEPLRSALIRLLQAAGYEARGYASACDFIIDFAETRPGCTVLDVRMPGPDGLDLHEALRRRTRALPVIFLTGHGDIPMSVRAMKAGAIDFLTKPVERHALLGAVRRALEADAAVRRAQDEVRSSREHYETLTPREREVFEGVIAGKLNKQIAADLGAAERTIKAHRAHVMQKMQVDSVAQLVRLAEHMGRAT
jgi:FixJ family two-component response regulator